MRPVPLTFIIAGLIVILAIDFAILWLLGADDTISGFVRYWHERSWWPMIIFLGLCIALFLHFFLGLPERLWE